MPDAAVERRHGASTTVNGAHSCRTLSTEVNTNRPETSTTSDDDHNTDIAQDNPYCLAVWQMSEADFHWPSALLGLQQHQYVPGATIDESESFAASQS